MRYIFQLGGHFRFVKLFDEINDAIEYARLRIEPKNWNKEKEYVGWGLDNELAEVSGELRKSLDTPNSFANIKSSKLMIRAVTAPRFVVGGLARVNKTLETTTPEEFENKTGFGEELRMWWEAQIEVSLKYVQLCDEVKVEGQPYQPAREQQGQTEWFVVHLMHRHESETRLSIDPTPRNLPPRGRRECVPMVPKEYCHALTNQIIKLTTTED